MKHFFQKLFRRIGRKSFQIDLEYENSYPLAKGFVYPNTLVVQAALENYFLKTGEKMEYISREKPIVFRLNGKTSYQANVEMVTGRFYSGYAILCKEVLEEEKP